MFTNLKYMHFGRFIALIIAAISLCIIPLYAEELSEFILIPGGAFILGDRSGTGEEIERPVSRVELDPFYLGRFEVTQSKWEQMMAANPSRANGIGPHHPVYYVSWYAALVYCNTRSIAEGLEPVYRILGSTNPRDWGAVPRLRNNPDWDAVIWQRSANGYRLPTEAEWEYAARAASDDPDHLYAGGEEIDELAWYNGNNLPPGVKAVGQKQPNALGLYDMSGNVWEWCWNWYNHYDASDKLNPVGSLGGSVKIFRGGSWYGGASNCRVTARNFAIPSFIHHFVGLRLARNAD